MADLVSAPFPQYFETDGTPLDSGSIYYGSVNQNPETNPVTVYWDSAGTIPAAQPIKTMGGYPVRNGTPATIYVGGQYSVTVKNKRGELVYYFPILGNAASSGNAPSGNAGLTKFGKNSVATGTGVQIGGADANGPDGTVLSNDGHFSWLRFQPSRDGSSIEAVFYPTGAQGIATAIVGTNQVTRVSGTVFDATWIGKKFYLGTNIYKVSNVINASTLTVQTVAGGAVSFASTYNETYHVVSVKGAGTCNVSGTTVTRVSGDPFIAFIGVPFVFKINGVTYTVSAFIDENTYTLSASPGTLTGASFTFETDINDQISTIRVQKVFGGNEENLAIYARYDGYWIHSLYSGSGKYRDVIIGAGEMSAGTLARQLICQSNGDLTICGDYEYEAIRVLNSANAVNRLQMQGAPTGFGPGWATRSSVDTNVDMASDTQGAGVHRFTTHSYGRTTFEMFPAATAASSWFGTLPGEQFVQLSVNGGSLADVDIAFLPKGNGRLRLGPTVGTGDVAITGYMIVKNQYGVDCKLALVA